ncbi:hypothetical protein PHJA_000697500, partial [Phtheirospermum japonicum]
WKAQRIDDPDGEVILKNEVDWNAEEQAISNANTKALNDIYFFVDVYLFMIISNLQTAKEAWDALQLFCEGSKGVQQTKLRMLATQFEVLRMEESGTITNYSAKLLDIANECQLLGTPISNESLVSKFLQSVTKIFNMKITSIEEDNDTSIMSFDELVGSLKTYKVELKIKQLKGRSVALISAPDYKDEDLDLDALAYEAENANLDEDGIALITRKFSDFLKKKNNSKRPFNRHFKSSSEHITPRPLGQSANRFQRKDVTPTSVKAKTRNQNSTKDLENVQCHECRGFGHYKYECANACVVWDDTGSMSDISCLNSFTLTKDDENEDIGAAYEELYEDWCKLVQKD